MNWDESNEYEPRATKNGATYQADGLAERVVVPGLKAVIVAIPAGLLAGLLIGAFSLAVSIWYAMPITSLIVFLVVFWGSSRRGQWLIERLTGADLNFDGYIGQPQPAPQLAAENVRIELIQNEGRRGDYIDLPYPDRLPQFAASVLEGRTYAQTAYVGTGKLFSRGEYDTLTAALSGCGLMRWKNPDFHNQGVELTYAGKAVFKRLANPSPPLSHQ